MTQRLTVKDVLVLILGGGRGTRLHPLTLMRSKPAVPIGGKYRLIDIPVSNCLHAELRRIFVLTQFNSASLNRHIAQTFRLDLFSGGWVEIIAAEQTPDSERWFQGTADAVRQAMRHFAGYDADYYLILAGDHLYRMNFAALVDHHIDTSADITVAAQPVSPRDATGMGVFRFDRTGQIVGFEEKPSAERLEAIGASLPTQTTFAAPREEGRPFVASMGIYLFSRDALFEALERTPGVDFGREIIPAALSQYRVHAYFHRSYWADVGTIESFYDANIHITQPGARFSFYDPERPIYTHPRFLPAVRFAGCSLDNALVAEGCFLDGCTVRDSVVGIRTRVGSGAAIERSVLLGADSYDRDDDAPAGAPRLGIGRDVRLRRAIVDKNARIGDGARLVNEGDVREADGDGYTIRNGIIIVPKGGVIPPGFVI